MHSAFEVHLLNELGVSKARSIAISFDLALREIEDTCGTEGREMAIVRTKLEEACFYAKKAMASRSENQRARHESQR